MRRVCTEKAGSSVGGKRAPVPGCVSVSSGERNEPGPQPPRTAAGSQRPRGAAHRCMGAGVQMSGASGGSRSRSAAGGDAWTLDSGSF